MYFAERSVVLKTNYQDAFNYLSDPSLLPDWTYAFASVDAEGTAIMRSPMGETPVKLQLSTDAQSGVIDTKMIFPDDSVGIARSRLLPLDQHSCLYSFVLTQAPEQLERIEGNFEQQVASLENELKTLQRKWEVTNLAAN